LESFQITWLGSVSSSGCIFTKVLSIQLKLLLNTKNDRNTRISLHCMEILGAVSVEELITGTFSIIKLLKISSGIKFVIKETNRYLRAAALSQENVQHVLASAVQYVTNSVQMRRHLKRIMQSDLVVHKD